MPSSRAYRSLGATLVVLASLSVEAEAAADPTEPASSSTEEAAKLYADGAQLFVEGKPREALVLLERSFELHPSPSSSLLIARCQRDIGRTEEAADTYDRTIAEAERLAEAGDAVHA